MTHETELSPQKALRPSAGRGASRACRMAVEATERELKGWIETRQIYNTKEKKNGRFSLLCSKNTMLAVSTVPETTAGVLALLTSVLAVLRLG